MGEKQLEKGFNSTSVKYCHAIRIIAALRSLCFLCTGRRHP